MQVQDVDMYILRRSKITERVKNVLINQLNLPLTPDQITEDTLLYGLGLGLNSVDTLEIIIGLESEFKTTINPDDMSNFRSVNTLIDSVYNKVQNA